jgi:hypothetical protein
MTRHRNRFVFHEPLDNHADLLADSGLFKARSWSNDGEFSSFR